MRKERGTTAVAPRAGWGRGTQRGQEGWSLEGGMVSGRREGAVQREKRQSEGALTSGTLGEEERESGKMTDIKFKLLAQKETQLIKPCFL